MAKGQDYVETWEGGFIRRDAKGRKVYVIRKMIEGTVYKVSTRAHSASAAVEQLRRFEADPSHYSPGGGPSGEPLLLDEHLAQAFLFWSRDEKKNSREWLEKQKRYLAWWADRLAGLDLRTGSGGRRVQLTEHILPALASAPNRQHRIAVLKAFYGWLRKERHLITPAQDPTLETLVVPQARPAQWRRSKDIPAEHYLKAREHLASHWRDGMDVQAGTGWHVSEVMRFAKSGTIEPHRGKAQEAGGVLVCPQTKSGETLRTAVSAEVLEAGKRLRQRGTFGREKYGMAVRAACEAAGVPPFTPGRFRHAVATWAINNGADPAQVAAFLNHKSPSTTRKFYATHATPTKVPTLR
ncbi:tyrosine-type recombinase/integrase [Aggregicoccus sp. 17bor-14]|uniref:site-specific integrase n=1 Tax=Myxococcaceae TaxID=31 RepID=UPI00129CE538|nr:MULTISPECIES: site-specific integrase [Myxococcaceae]MBF5043182.1 tyrosine-type recombinase/integrase [Simulacricoccus sp. 17bor-14]MRI88940.1 tyrosine-type recombinase/integrase [Aggregicoccus sp. 17bor-14]